MLNMRTLAKMRSISDLLIALNVIVPNPDTPKIGSANNKTATALMSAFSMLGTSSATILFISLKRCEKGVAPMAISVRPWMLSYLR